MSLSTKTFVVVVAAFSALASMLYLSAHLIVGQIFTGIEQRQMLVDMERSVSMINDELGPLSQTNLDYAAWDDSYAFIADGNPAYIQSNLSDGTFVANRFSLVAYFDNDGAIVYCKAYNLREQHAETSDNPLCMFVADSLTLRNLSGSESSVSGLLMTPDGLLMISAQPILTSTYSGPPRGTLVMARLLNESELERLAATLHLQLSIHRLDAGVMDHDLAAAVADLGAATTVVISPLNAESFAGYSFLRDLAGQPVAVLRVVTNRSLYAQGQMTIRYLALALIAAGAVLALIMVVSLNYAVLARLIRLGQGLSAIGSGADITRRVVVEGSDEIAALARDINHMLATLARSQEELQESETRFRRLVEVAPDAILVCDGDELLFVNPAGATLLGYASPDQCVGLPLRRFTYGLDGPSFAAGRQAEVTLSEDVFWRADGSQVEVEYVAVPLSFKGRATTQVIVRDITMRRMAEAAMREAKEAAETANRAKSAFLANMSHELRTPLTAILGYTDLIALEAKAKAPEFLEDLDHIRSSGMHLLVLINDVLDLSKIEAGRMNVLVEPCAPGALIAEVVDTIRPLAEKGNNHIEVRLAEQLPVIHTDITKLRQILLNLTNNACKFTLGGHVLISVTPVDLAEGLGVSFEVVDTGIGITPEQIGQIFQDFQQAEPFITRRYGGTGLGLAISRRLCHLLGGEINVVSTPGVGSCFSFTLPSVPYSALQAHHN